MIDYRKNLHDAAPGMALVEISALALLTDPQGNLLLVRDKDDVYWHLLGGWLGPDETIRECLQRSVLKNCSILLESCSLLKVFSGSDLNYFSDFLNIFLFMDVIKKYKLLYFTMSCDYDVVEYLSKS